MASFESFNDVNRTIVWFNQTNALFNIIIINTLLVLLV